MKHKVVHIITRLELGGAQRNTLYTVANLDRERFEPVLVCGRGGILDEEAQAGGVETIFVEALVREVRPLKDAAALLSLIRILRRLRPSIVHTHSSKAGILGRLAARLTSVPVIIHTVHGFSFSPYHSRAKRFLYRLAERLVAPLTTRFFCVSRANLEEGVRLGLWERGRADVVRSGISLEKYAGAGEDPGEDPAGIRRDLGIPDGAPVVGSVGNFKPQKAPLDLVEAFALVAREVPEAVLVVAGDGPLREEAEQAVARHGLGDRVHLLGWRHDVPRLLRAFDLFLLVSLWEGLPRALLQARAAGLPAVATAVDGSVEAVEEGKTGFLVPARDPGTAAARVVALLRDPGLRTRMGRAAREGLEEFAITTMVERQGEIYDQLLRSADPSRTRGTEAIRS